MGSTARFLIEQSDQKRRRRRQFYLWIGLLVGVVVLIWHFGLQPLFESGMGMADTRPVPGDPAHFDPLAALPAVRAYAGEDVQFISMEARFVRSDGTLDLTAESYRPEVTYTFVREVSPPADAPPLGAGGSASAIWYQTITITAYRPGQWRNVVTGSTEYNYMNQGMERDTRDPDNDPPGAIIAEPTCGLQTLWAVALEREAPAGAVAVIRYISDSYTFTIQDTNVNLRFDDSCQMVN